MRKQQTASAEVVAVQDDIVSIRTLDSTQHALMKNEVVYILPTRHQGANYQPHLKAEVLRIKGDIADAQVYESTTGVAIGDPVIQSGEMLSVELGPGLLGQVFDGLQNPLDEIAGQFGFFLPKGVDLPALDTHKKWAFTPCVHCNDRLHAGAVIGTVVEHQFTHKIMLPFDLLESVELVWIQAGNVTVDEPVAQIKRGNGQIQNITLKQDWPVRIPLPKQLFKHNLTQRCYPHEPLITQLRIIDTFFPIARGGTGCIPGPFGAGKTVLQNLLAKNSDVDIVIVVACGERAGEVVETITTFPQLADPKGTGSLMDRTIIICNTSSMPVAAREASIYTGITLGEYYRQMGLDVLLIADSTSRWAQAMRETSGRLEEIPGEEAFPAYLDSTIKSVYERAGVIKTTDHQDGALTLIGTVSPAGGNFEEPVTQSTLSTVKTFLGLSADRAYKHFYPAIDPLISWSRYLEQLQVWYARNLQPDWTAKVQQVLELLKQGDEVLQMIQVAGEEGITQEDFILYLKAQFVDTVYLQQDAFDDVDVAAPLSRQHEQFRQISDIVLRDYAFSGRTDARHFFMQLSHLFKNLNYSPYQSKDYQELMEKIKHTCSGL